MLLLIHHLEGLTTMYTTTSPSTLRLVFSRFAFITGLLCHASFAEAQWQPPIGIPPPAFGITETARATPNPWSTAISGFYYVEPSNGSATDSGNVYGTPALPRKTIPKSLPAGSVVELHGIYDTAHLSPNDIVVNGTAAAPVFIRGVACCNTATIRNRFIISGSYFIVENILFGSNQTSDPRVTVSYPTTHGVVRGSEISGHTNGGVGLGVSGISATNTIDNVVVYNNKIHNNGVWTNNVGDNDWEGILVNAFTSYIWVVDNELYFNEGTGFSIGAGSRANEATTHHIYVGRNISHHNKEAGFGLKQAQDVIYSQNTAYGHRLSSSADGSCMGLQYAPERVWYLLNHCYDNENGITVVSDNGLGSGKNSYFIGNLIHNIHSKPENFRAGSPWSAGTGLQLIGHTNRAAINNTIYDVDNGITGAASGGSGYVHIVNNVISNVTNSQGSHIFLESPTVAAASAMHHNLLEGNVRIKWGSDSTLYDLPRFQSTFPGKGLNVLNTNPLFVDAAGGDFRPQANSPVIDAGIVDDVYQNFLNLYGIDIAKDMRGTPRLQTTIPDLGAFESGSGPIALPVPKAPTALSVN